MASGNEQLQRLVDDDDVDGLLSLVSLDDIAAAWCRHIADDRDDVVDDDDDDDPDWWAVELFFGTEIFKRPELYQALLLKLIEHANDELLGAIGAGPLENFINDDEDFLLWLETECARNPRLRRALLGTYYVGWVSGVTAVRVAYAATTQRDGPRPRDEWPPELIAYDEAEQRLHEVSGRAWWLVYKPTAEQAKAHTAYLEAEQRLRDSGAFTEPSEH